MRHGSRTAASPPGSGTGSSQATRSNDVEVEAQELAAPERPVRSVARAVEDDRERGPVLAVLGQARGGVRVVVLHADGLERPARAPTSSRGTRGGGRGRRPPARRRASRGRARDRSGTRGRRAPSRGRRDAARGMPRRPRRRRTCSSARLRPRRAAGAPGREGEAARARSRASGGSGSAARTTESSQRRWIGRSCARKASAMSPSRRSASASSIAIGSSERFPLVITSGASEVGAEQVVERGVGEHHAEPRRPRRDRRRRRRASPAPREHDRPRAASAAAPPRPTRARRGVPGSAVITRERLLLAVLSLAQASDGILVASRRRRGGSRRGP